MKSEELLELLNGIGSDLVENAGSVAEMYESSREGVSFRAEYSRKRTWKTVIASVAATAAAVFGLFALVNIVRGGFFNYRGGPGDPDRSGYIYSSEEQTFTKDYDGLVLTVTTDKSTYRVGETINLTASLENNTKYIIELISGIWQEEYAFDFTAYFEDLIEYPIRPEPVYDKPTTVKLLGPGEKYVKEYTFQTYTDYSLAPLNGAHDLTPSIPDLSKPAALGVYHGSLRAQAQRSDSAYYGTSLFYYTTYTLDFSVTLIEGDIDSENKGQTFTEDFDGLVLTVTTDKTEYNIGDTIHLTATLENNRDEEVYLYYGNSPIDYTVELSPRFEDLIEYPHEIVSRDAAITIITVKPGEKYVRDLTFLTYTDYIESVSETWGIKYYPDYGKPALPGVHNGTLSILTCPNNGNYDDITEYTLKFSVTVASSNENNDSDTESEPSEKVTGIYGETEIPDIPCGDKEREGKANVIKQSGALRQSLDSMVFETHNFGDYTVKLIGDSVRTDKQNFPDSIYAQKLRIEVEKNGTKLGVIGYNDTLLYQSQFHTEYRLFADKIGSYLDIYELDCPVIAMRYFFDDDPARTVTKAVEFAVIRDDTLCGGFVGASAAGTGVTMNPNMDWGDYRTILAPNTSDGERCRLSVFAADEFTVADGKTLTDGKAGIRYTFDFSDPLPFELYAADKLG